MKTILILAMISSTIFIATASNTSPKPIIQIESTSFGEPDLQHDALQVLIRKCNFCHQTKNRRTVFTRANMKEMAPKINKQVFVKKRMPKGKDNTLTEEESQTLKKWLDSLPNVG